MFEGIGPNYKIIKLIRQIFQGCGYICRTCFIRKVNNILNIEVDMLILMVDTDNYSSMCKSNVCAIGLTRAGKKYYPVCPGRK